MPDNTENEANVIAVLSKKFDDQTRFICMLVILCCLTILACTFYSLTSMIAVLPDLTYAKLIGNLDGVQRQWQLLDKLAMSKSSTNSNTKEKKH